MNFGHNFKRICLDRGTTPTAVLHKLGLSTSKGTMWSNGTIPKVETITRLCDELGCKPYEFFVDDPSELIQASTATADVLTEDEQQILSIYRAMSRRDQHVLMVDLYTRDPRSQSTH